MRFGLRDGFGFLKSIVGNFEIKAYWEKDQPIGNVIIQRPYEFTGIFQFENGVPNGRFDFPVGFMNMHGHLEYESGVMNFDANFVIADTTFHAIGKVDP